MTGTPILLIGATALVVWAATTVHANGDGALSTTDPSTPEAGEVACGTAHRARMLRTIDGIEAFRGGCNARENEWAKLEAKRELYLLHRMYAKCEGIDYGPR
jgi:uncharacterized protein (DUF58 family)